MDQNQSSYRQIMKATSLFGGVQVFNIIIQIIRSKFVAVLLGPTGMGIIGLLISTTGIISNLTNFGLGTSAVKNIASASASGDQERIEVVVTVIRKMVWITGLLGCLALGILAPWLSLLTFGSREYTLAFVWISITLLFNQLSSGQLVVLQGLRKLNYLAKANLAGSFTSLLVTVPIYYFWRLDGIVPGIIVMSIISLLMSWYFSEKVNVNKAILPAKQTVDEAGDILKMGFMISLNGILVIGVSYIVRIFISRTGSLEHVGLYNAGFVIINTYVSLIFNAMATDYYPRLSAISDDNKLCKLTINQQAEIALLILAPIIIIFLVFIKWIIILLYSNRFIEVNSMIQWAALGMFFKTIGWSISFIFLAKGATKLFFWNELIANAYILGLNLIGYYFWGLTGLGIGFTVSYLIYAIQVFVVSKIKFAFEFDISFIKIFIIQLSLAITTFLVVKLTDHYLMYFLGSLIILLSTWLSFNQLNKKLGLIELFNKFKLNQLIDF